MYAKSRTIVKENKHRQCEKISWCGALSMAVRFCVLCLAMYGVFGLLVQFLPKHEALAVEKQESPDVVDGEADPQNKFHNVVRRRPSIIDMEAGANKAMEALQYNPFHNQSVWDQNILQRDGKLSASLHRFLDGQYAYSVKNFVIPSDSSVESISKSLLSSGFIEIDPKHFPHQDKSKKYVFMHKDGGMVVIKESNDNRSYRPQSYISKVVLFKNIEDNMSDEDIAKLAVWENEAFKVTNKGIPVPKGTKQTYGMRSHATSTSGRDEDRGWTKCIMNYAHFDISENNKQASSSSTVDSMVD